MNTKTKSSKSKKETKVTSDKKTIVFEGKAVDFLNEFKEKLKLNSVNEVISTSFELLSVLDHLHNTGGQLIYKNEKNELFPISLYDTETNKGVLSTLKSSN